MSEIQIINLGLDRIHPGRWQPRDREQMTDESLAELAADITARGLINPVIGVALRNDGGPVEVELIAGERRWRAAKLAHLHSLPVWLVMGPDRELREMAIADNLQREDLTPLEEARALQQLQEIHDFSQRELAKHLNKSQGWVQQRIALLDASPAVQEMVNTRVFDLSHARALSGLPDAVQEVAARHLDAEQMRGVPITTRQVTNVGKRIRQFLDPERFADVEQQIVDPEMRNAWIMLRHLLRTLPEARLSLALQRLLQADKAEDTRLIGAKMPDRQQTQALIELLHDPAAWKGGYYAGRSPWWTTQVAEELGRTCANCILKGVEYPGEQRSWYDYPCRRWENPDTDPVSCSRCTLESDACVIRMSGYTVGAGDPAVKQGEGYLRYVSSVDDYLRIAAAAAEEARQNVEKAESDKVDENRRRLEEFSQRCEAALHALEETDLLNVEHFQAQWCDRCALYGNDAQCEFVHNPLGDGWNRKPALAVWAQIVEYKDVEDKAYKRVDRFVPRCEMFRYSLAPVVALTGFVSFPLDKRERRRTVIRWLEAILNDITSYTPNGVWSPLRWLPYDRPAGKHYDRSRLFRYLLDSWDDEWGDTGIGTLLSAAASERAVLEWRGRTHMSIFNPETGEDESWILLSWQAYLDGKRPGSWPDKIEWPLEAEE